MEVKGFVGRLENAKKKVIKMGKASTQVHLGVMKRQIIFFIILSEFA